jgi:hypothetical protein
MGLLTFNNRYRGKDMETLKVEGEHEISVKRLYLPIEIEVKCSHCRAKLTKDFEVDYLSYPKTNKKEPIYLYCDYCDTESEFDATLTISLEVDTETRKIG